MDHLRNIKKEVKRGYETYLEVVRVKSLCELLVNKRRNWVWYRNITGIEKRLTPPFSSGWQIQEKSKLKSAANRKDVFVSQQQPKVIRNKSSAKMTPC